MLLVNIGFFVLACFLLVQSNNYLIRSLSKLSYFLRLTEFTVGFMLVAVGTSLPELFVGVMSAFQKVPEFSVGNVIGSNILDLTLVIGVATLLAKNISIESKIVKKDMVYMLLITILPVVLLADHHFWHWLGLFPEMTTGLSRLDGIVLLFVFGFYMYNLMRQESKFSKTISTTSRREALKYVVIFIASLSLLLISSHFVVSSGKALSLDLNMSPLLMGLFLISFGTSLPELMFETKAVMSQHQSMAIGDLIGSVITNSTLVLGLTAIISPVSINTLVYLTSTLFMLFSCFIFFTFAESDNRLTWTEGISMLFLYVLFIIIETYIKTIG